MNSLTLDLGFESYAPAIAANTKKGVSDFLGKGLAIQEPWTYTGQFQLGKSGNSPWGGVDSVDGTVYAIFQRDSSIEQEITNLVPGSVYVVNWSQRGRQNYGSVNDIHISLDGSNVYSQSSVPKGPREAKSSAQFNANSVSALLKIWSTNPGGGDRTVFIDAISVNKVKVQGSFLSFISRSQL